MTSGIIDPLAKSTDFVPVSPGSPQTKNLAKKGVIGASLGVSERRSVNWRPRSSMRRGAKSKGFVTPDARGCRLKGRNKILECQQKFTLAGGRPAPFADVREKPARDWRQAARSRRWPCDSGGCL